MIKKILIFGAILLLVSAASAQPGKGARQVGMGNAFVGVADDGYAAAWNPGGLTLLTYHQFSLMYGSLYSGMRNDNLGESYVGVVAHAWPEFAFGGDWERIGSNIYSRNSFGFPLAAALSYSPDFIFSIGVRPRLLYDSYNLNDLGPAADNDPAFNASGSKMMFDLDAGMIMSFSRAFTIGLAGLNLIAPLPNIDNDAIAGQAMLPRRLVLGMSGNIGGMFVPAADFGFVFDGQKTRTILNAGMELWLLKDEFALRGGYSTEQQSFNTGMSYRWLKDNYGVQLDYAMALPLGDIRNASPTTHKLALNLLLLVGDAPTQEPSRDGHQPQPQQRRGPPPPRR